MSEKKFDIVAVGNAVVDVISYRNEQFITKHNLHKGATSLLTEAQMEDLYRDMGASTECSGGCSANTAVGVSMLGGQVAFISKVNHDYGGNVFRKSLDKNGVFLQEPHHEATDQTTRCMILITDEDDGSVERTMAAYLGAGNELEEDDIDEELIASSKIMFFEGFLWDTESGRKSAQRAIDIAQKHGVKIAMSLSDPLCIRRNREHFLQLIAEHIDIFFCNEPEACELFEISEEPKLLYKFIELCKSGKVDLAAITRGSKGSFLICNDEIHTIEAQSVSNVYDVTGAGDMYAAGVLYGYINNMDIATCGKLGSMCASEVIRYLGARPVTDLKELLEKLDNRPIFS